MAERASGDRRAQVSTTSAPSVIGPYSQAIITAAGLVFVSGQIPIDPSTDALIAGGLVEETHQVLRNLSAILEAAGSSLDRVVKTTVYLADMNDFSVMNGVYATYFPAPAPARATIQAARLPRDARIEIDAVAVL